MLKVVLKNDQVFYGTLEQDRAKELIIMIDPEVDSDNDGSGQEGAVNELVTIPKEHILFVSDFSIEDEDDEDEDEDNNSGGKSEVRKSVTPLLG